MLEHMYPKIDEQMWALICERQQQQHQKIGKEWMHATKKMGRTNIENFGKSKRNKSKESLELNSLSDLFVGACIYVHWLSFFSLFLALGLNFHFAFLVTSLCTGISAPQSSLFIVPVIDMVGVLLKSLQNSTNSHALKHLQRQLKQVSWWNGIQCIQNRINNAVDARNLVASSLCSKWVKATQQKMD